MSVLASIGSVLSMTSAQGAVPFTAGHGDGSSSLIPLLVIVLLAGLASQLRRGRGRVTKAR